MIGRRVLSVLKSRAAAAEEGKAKTWGRRAVSGALICLTGGVALSALDDLVIYHCCSSKALEKASKNQAIIEAIGLWNFQLKAVRNGEDTWFSILRPRDWEILIMEALLHVPGNEKKEQTFRISISDNPPLECKPCTACRAQPSASAEENQPQPA
ncbi:UNVERIFIED_CONTAM: hypothetical protein Sradi_6240700 [Sesamum radiatum]|uniref:Uncharacterized protein n=1 Tax=Sesamum radiatum TaxID=300843 RepID=A0AAW2KB56_SESRA